MRSCSTHCGLSIFKGAVPFSITLNSHLHQQVQLALSAGVIQICQTAKIVKKTFSTKRRAPLWMMLCNVLQDSKLLSLLLHVVHHRNETLWSILWRLVVFRKP